MGELIGSGVEGGSSRTGRPSSNLDEVPLEPASGAGRDGRDPVFEESEEACAAVAKFLY